MRTDTNLQIVVENSFLPLHQGMCLWPDVSGNYTALEISHD